MSPDITVSGLSFVQQYSDKNDGSLRREISRGASTPTEVLIKHQEYVDSRTKQPGFRSLVAIDYYMTMTDGVIRPVRLQCVLARPNDPLVTQAIISSIEAMMVNLLHGTANANGLGLEDEIFSGRQQ